MSVELDESQKCAWQCFYRYIWIPNLFNANIRTGKKTLTLNQTITSHLSIWSVEYYRWDTRTCRQMNRYTKDFFFFFKIAVLIPVFPTIWKKKYIYIRLLKSSQHGIKCSIISCSQYICYVTLLSFLGVCYRKSLNW